MKEARSQKQGKKQLTDVKTFTVPFTLETINENISIFTNTTKKPSKEELINQAIKFHATGNLSEAAKYYQDYINQGCNNPRIFLTYGTILQDLGKLHKAELSTRKAIQLNPDFIDAHCNLGLILMALGKLKEAEISLRKAIQLNPDSAILHFNLGVILRNLRQLKEAEISTRKAIKINPNFAQAYSNLGGILRDLKKLEDAEISLRKAIELKPNYAIGHSNLGSLLRDLGKLEEAEKSTRKAIKISPDYEEANSNLGVILSDLDKSQEALHYYLKTIEINPNNYHIYDAITNILRNSDPSIFNKSKLEKVVTLLLEKDNIDHKYLFNSFKFLYGNKIINNIEQIDSNPNNTDLFINKKLMLNALKKIIFRDIRFEKQLTKLRESICNRIAKNKEDLNQSQLKFISTLGEQCFLNEYVYSLSEEENKSINTIINRCSNGEINEQNITILSCYLPLYKLLDQIPSLKSFHSDNQSFQELIKLQISDPLKEIELSKSIKRLGPIIDSISQKVKSQYEENPYPRWRYKSSKESKNISNIDAINNEIKPNLIRQNAFESQTKVLIAGCGTGGQIINTQRYKNALITGLDLSLSSLSYAQRKINELGIDNVKLIQMDILEINLLKEKFDIIECSGVLHHMDKPLKGLKTLLYNLEDNGFLKLGLYSELARQDIIKARKYIESQGLKPDAKSIRIFRQKIISGELNDLNALKSFGDFYSLSECRDLCFHTQEIRFTINEIADILISYNLKFLGFLLPKPVKSHYKKCFPEDKTQTNLKNWAKFEENHPHTFLGMYQFWVCKIKNKLI